MAPGAGRDLLWSPGSEKALVALIGSARHRLLVENEEMGAAPIIAALQSAARRGVQVEVVMTESSEWDSALNSLLQAGVHVRTYAYDAPLYIHAKAISVDGRRVFVGSENFSTESLDYNRELGIVTGSARSSPPSPRRWPRISPARGAGDLDGRIVGVPARRRAAPAFAKTFSTLRRGTEDSRMSTAPAELGQRMSAFGCGWFAVGCW